MSNEESKLLPCPFCGSDPEIIRPLGERIYTESPPFYGPNFFRVVCTSHKCSGSGWACSTEPESISSWNTRDQSEALAMVAAEREACAKMLNRYAAEKGSTKTPQGRTANFYGRKIRARTPADAQDALEAHDKRVRAEAREQALREAAEKARRTVECCQSCASVELDILALIEGEQTDG